MIKEVKAGLVIMLVFISHGLFFYFGYTIGLDFSVEPDTKPDSAVVVLQPDQIVSVYDGDTFKVNIPEWPDIVGESISIRVDGIDTPEIRGTSENIKLLASEARQATASFLQMGAIELRDLERGKYFRITASVFAGDTSLADVLIEKGLAKPYDGESSRPTWTQEDYDDYFRSNGNGSRDRHAPEASD